MKTYYRIYDAIADRIGDYVWWRRFKKNVARQARDEARQT